MPKIKQKTYFSDLKDTSLDVVLRKRSEAAKAFKEALNNARDWVATKASEYTNQKTLMAFDVLVTMHDLKLNVSDQELADFINSDLAENEKPVINRSWINAVKNVMVKLLGEKINVFTDINTIAKIRLGFKNGHVMIDGEQHSFTVRQIEGAWKEQKGTTTPQGSGTRQTSVEKVANSILRNSDTEDKELAKGLAELAVNGAKGAGQHLVATSLKAITDLDKQLDAMIDGINSFEATMRAQGQFRFSVSGLHNLKLACATLDETASVILADREAGKAGSTTNENADLDQAA